MQVVKLLGWKWQSLTTVCWWSIMEFIEATFPYLQNLRPGKWHIAKLGNRNSIKTSSFSQYEHLEYLSQLTKEDARPAASMGNDYMVAPDVVVYRETISDLPLYLAV